MLSFQSHEQKAARAARQSRALNSSGQNCLFSGEKWLFRRRPRSVGRFQVLEAISYDDEGKSSKCNSSLERVEIAPPVRTISREGIETQL